MIFIINSFVLILLSGYVCFLFYMMRGLGKHGDSQNSELPSVSIIVPCHNEEKNLPRLLEHLSVIQYPKKLIEIILVNDRSDDRTGQIIKDYAAKHKNVLDIHIVDTNPEISPKKRAINEAICRASGKIILTTDADTTPAPEWVREIVKLYDTDTSMVLGYAPYRIDGVYDSIFHRIVALEYLALAAVAAASCGIGFPLTCNGANLSYRRDIFLKVGGFGDSAGWISGDDDLLLHRIKKMYSKLKIKYAVSPKSVVFTDPPETFSRFVRQRIRFASKHLAYPLKVRILLSAIYGFNLSLLILGISALFNPLQILPFFFTIILKSFAEIPFLLRGQNLLENRNLVKYYPLAMLPHIIYVITFPLLGLFFRNRW